MGKFKFPYRRTEAALASAEKTDSAISALVEKSAQDLVPAWKSVLFSSFHDILPGSSIERAYEDQLAWLGAAYHQAQRSQFNALNALALRVDTSVPKPADDHPSRLAFLVWNPHPHEYAGPVELEASLDYRPLFAYEHKPDHVPVELVDSKGRPVPFQLIATECSIFPHLPWRKRLVFRAKLPPLGWSIFQMGLARQTPKLKSPAPVAAARANTIRNDSYRISVRKGATGLQIFHKNRPIFAGPGLSVINVEDPWGSWGGMTEEQESTTLAHIQEKWKITDWSVREPGPERAALWVRFAGAKSRLDLTFHLSRQRPVVDVQARVFWSERSSRLKLVFPVGDQAEFEVPGGQAARGVCGEVPGGRWVRVTGPRGEFGFASDALYGFNCQQGRLCATVVRASRYANDVVTPAQGDLWRPAVDAGELNFRFLLTTDTSSLLRLAQELEQPVVAQVVAPHPGALARTGSLLALKPASVQLLALKPAGDGNGWIVRVQETAGKSVRLTGRWLDQPIDFGLVSAWSIHSFRLMKGGGSWTAKTTNIQEHDL